jgi:uncharacterized membrane protein HdeD (DUF308 family)
MDMQRVDMQRAGRELAHWWWAWLVSGIVWIIAALVILQFNRASVVTVGIIVGVMFIVSGIEGLLVAQVGGGWKWLTITLGILLLIGGLFALFNPVVAFLAVADILGFVFTLIGIFWILEALATQQENALWGLGLVAGIIMIALGFATVAKLLPSRAYMLLVLAGIWALLHGITDIVKAFQIRHLGELAAAGTGPAPTGPALSGPAPTEPMTGPTTDGPLPPWSATPRATP